MVLSILEEFPALKIAEICQREMSRLTSEDSLKILETNLIKSSENILNFIKNKKKRTERCNDILKEMESVISVLDEITPQAVAIHKHIATCLMLPYLFEEDDKSFILCKLNFICSQICL